MTDLQHAIEQGQAQFDSIKEMVEKLRSFEPANGGDEQDDYEDAREAIEQDPLSVQVRSAWYTPGAETDSRGQSRAIKPAEYEILLCTGGPACRIIGQLSEHGEPETAVMQVQDWGTPWTDLSMSEMLLYHSRITPSQADEILLDYCRCFYFGE